MAPKYLATALNALVVLSALSPSFASPTVQFVSNIGKRDGIIPALPGTWTSLGCYNEIGRTLTGPSYDNSTTNTIELCIGFCSAKGFIYAGTEYSSQCWCGNTITPPSQTSTGCTMTCSGNSTEACGGPDRLNIFWSGQSGPQTNPGPGLWASLGCFAEQPGRILTNGVTTVGGAEAMTIATCTSACRAAGYNLAGAEYGQECWCGNTLSNGGALAPEGLSGCNTLCSGNASEYCGGPSRLNVYNFNGTFTPPTPTTTTTVSPTAVPTAGAYVYYGCQTEGFNVRALGAKSTSSPTMTIATCEAFCSGYEYFGTEYGQECYCGNSFGNGSVPVSDSECNFVCPGDVTEFCGAGNRLSVYQRDASIPVPTSTPTAPPATLPSGWGFQGCWVDGEFGRVLSTQQPDSATLTIESCVNTCAAAGFTIAGLEYSSQCFCDTIIRNHGSRAIAQTDCNMPCSGNSAQICGAGNRLSLYNTGTLVIAP